MSKFNVGDEVIHPETGRVHKVTEVKGHGVCIDEPNPPNVLETVYGFAFIKHYVPKPKPILVYAVCDEDHNIMELFLNKEYAESYTGNPRQAYYIQTFHLTPVNEE